MTDPADRPTGVGHPTDTQTTVEEAIVAALPNLFRLTNPVLGEVLRNELARDVCAALSLDPAEPLDGQVVVLHPGQKVIEVRVPNPGEVYWNDGTWRMVGMPGDHDGAQPVVVRSAPSPERGMPTLNNTDEATG